MNNIKRIAIIGNAGSGKSTLAQKLSQILRLPVYHLDKYFWKPNWTQPDPEEYKKIHNELCDQEEWITDGMNLRLLDYRIQRADVIIFLDIPRFTCLLRITKRAIKYYGQERPTGAHKCPERINWAFIKFLKWAWDFKANYRPKIYELLNAYKNTKKIYVLKNQQEIDQCLEELSHYTKIGCRLNSEI